MKIANNGRNNPLRGFRAVAGWLSSLLLPVALLFGCAGVEISDSENIPYRTLLLYLGGDNNLSPETDTRMEALKTVPIASRCRLPVFVDTKDTAPRLMELTEGEESNKLTLIQEYDESNSADATFFSTLLNEIVERYPASSYGLLLFSHATGWLPEGAYANPGAYSGVYAGDTALRSVLKDGNTEMEIPAFAAAIPAGMFDFIVFEACFMAGIEVAWELKEKTRYIVASSAELVSPGFSSCYASALPFLFTEQPDLVNFCRAVESDYLIRRGDYASLTLSLIDTNGLDALAGLLCGTGIPQANESVQCFDRYGGKLFFDLEDCYTHSLPEKAAELKAAIETTVIWKAATAGFMLNYGGFTVENHSGLTTYIVQEDYSGLNEAYKKMKWYQFTASP